MDGLGFGGKSSIFVGFSLNQPFWGTPHLWKLPHSLPHRCETRDRWEPGPIEGKGFDVPGAVEPSRGGAVQGAEPLAPWKPCGFQP